MRGKKAKKRNTLPDGLYGSITVTRLINFVMNDGKKKVAEGIVYGALDKLAEQTRLKPIEALEKSLDNIKPKIEVKSRRVGGANYQVPVPVDGDRQTVLALRWIISAARANKAGKDFVDKLYSEFLDAFNKQGSAYKKREDTHRMAEANKAFSHLSW